MDTMKPMIRSNAKVFLGITHGSCMACGYVSFIEKFEIRWVELPPSDGKNWYGAFAKCPICSSENCEFLMEDEVN